MASDDRVVSIHPYFKFAPENRAAVEKFCERFVDLASKESGCLYYGFSFREGEVHCREAYDDAEAALAHVANVGHLFPEFFQIAELARLEIHGIDEELAKLRGPLADLNPTWYTLQLAIRRG